VSSALGFTDSTHLVEGRCLCDVEERDLPADPASERRHGREDAIALRQAHRPAGGEAEQVANLLSARAVLPVKERTLTRSIAMIRSIGLERLWSGKRWSARA